MFPSCPTLAAALLLAGSALATPAPRTWSGAPAPGEQRRAPERAQQGLQALEAGRGGLGAEARAHAHAALPADGERALICHVPPGRPEAFHEILVGASAIEAHLAHGDLLGSCEDLCLDSGDCGYDADALPFPGTEFCYRGEGEIGFTGGGPALDCDRGVGVCVEVNPICARIFDPVCGCDGALYTNACEAQRAGVNWEAAAEPVDDDGDGSIDGYSCEL